MSGGVHLRGEERQAGLPRHVIGRLLLLLAGAAGALDLFCVVRLGGPFASVITGNLVQVGRGVSAPEPRLAALAAVTVAFYAAGVAVAAVALRGRPPGWYAWTSALAAAEVVLVAAVVVGWLATDGRPGSVVSGVMLALAGGAMGVQSALSMSTGLRRASTTYLTGTLTGLAQGAVAPSRPAGLGRLVALLAGAVAAGFVLRFAPLWTPALPLALLAAAVVLALAWWQLPAPDPTDNDQE